MCLTSHHHLLHCLSKSSIASEQYNRFFKFIFPDLLVSSRCSVSQSAAQKTAREKIKKPGERSERMPVGKLNKRSFRYYTRIWYTLWLVNFDRFCQHSSITDSDEIYDMAAIRDLSTSNVMFKSAINNKLDNSMVACLALEAIMKDQVEQLNTIGVAAAAMSVD